MYASMGNEGLNQLTEVVQHTDPCQRDMSSRVMTSDPVIPLSLKRDSAVLYVEYLCGKVGEVFTRVFASRRSYKSRLGVHIIPRSRIDEMALASECIPERAIVHPETF